MPSWRRGWRTDTYTRGGIQKVRLGMGRHGATGGRPGTVCQGAGLEAASRRRGRVWTDDFSNVVGAVQWQFSWDWLVPSQWWPSQNGTAKYHSTLGVFLCEQGRLDEGMAQFQKALEIDPNFAEAHYNLGNALACLRRFDEAIDQFQQALKITPDDAKARKNLGVALQFRDKIDEEIARFERIVESEPGNVRAHSCLGNALGARGRLAEAITQYQIALKIAPDDAGGSEQSGLALGNLSRCRAAQQRPGD